MQGSLSMDNVPLMFGHFRPTRLAAIVWTEAVALEEVSEGDVVSAVVEHLDDTGGGGGGGGREGEGEGREGGGGGGGERGREGGREGGYM